MRPRRGFCFLGSLVLARGGLGFPARAAAPSRIVALAPSCAEILYALGAAPRVVGVSDFAKDLPESKGKARLGGFAPDLERIESLAPDLVVVSKDGTDLAAVRRLETLGHRIVVTDAASLDGVLADVRRVGRAIGEEPRAEELARSLSARIARAEEKAKARGGPPASAIAVVWPDPPILAGRETFVGDVLAHARLENAAPKGAGLWPRVSFETLASWDPRLVIRPDTPENRDAFAKAFAPGGKWELLRAVKEKRVLSLDGALLERPGPRLVEALERLVDALRSRSW
jgi:iron complex transport system substrate-binding protein